jgi:hypothetical protein
MCLPHWLSEQPDTISLEESAFFGTILSSATLKVLRLSCKGTDILTYINQFGLDGQIFFYKRPPVRNFTKIHPMGATRRDKQTDMTKLVDSC